METPTVTVRRLARELGIDRRKVKDFVRHRGLGVSSGLGRGVSKLLTENEAEVVRRELSPRLTLPEPEDVAAQLGQPVYSVTQAAQVLGLDRHTVSRYVELLGIGIQIRNGLEPSYVISAESLTAIWEAREQTIERMKRMLQEQAASASQIGGRKSQHGALMREERDYYGRVAAFTIEPTASEDPELSSETGPQYKTLQWRPFYPATENNPKLDLSVWHVSDHRQHLSLDRMLEDGDQI
jgi:hypothetical protein